MYQLKHSRDQPAELRKRGDRTPRSTFGHSHPLAVCFPREIRYRYIFVSFHLLTVYTPVGHTSSLSLQSRITIAPKQQQRWTPILAQILGPAMRSSVRVKLFGPRFFHWKYFIRSESWWFSPFSSKFLHKIHHRYELCTITSLLLLVMSTNRFENTTKIC